MHRRIPVDFTFCYHNVGEGLFYSGEIGTPWSRFVFIYDCGSENLQLVNSSIHRLYESAMYNIIDLLVLSHLHSDHVSGLRKLLSLFKVKSVVIPYLSPEERLLVALRRLDLPSWYYEFLSDPVKFLIEEGVERIIILGGEEGVPPEIPPRIYEEFRDDLDITTLPDDKRLADHIINRERGWKTYMDAGELLVKNHDGYVPAIGVWMFRFFNYKPPVHSLKQFLNCVNDFRPRGLDIREMIKEKTCLVSLRKCYDEVIDHLGRDLNNTSLVLYHGPFNRPRMRSSFPENYEYFRFIFSTLMGECLGPVSPRIREIRVYMDENFGQLLTGDVNLNFRYDELRRHYETHFNDVRIAMVPHHGSKHNWRRDLVYDLPNNSIWVISSGIYGTYGHPSKTVVRDIIENGICVWVNERSRFLCKGSVRC